MLTYNNPLFVQSTSRVLAHLISAIPCIKGTQLVILNTVEIKSRVVLYTEKPVYIATVQRLFAGKGHFMYASSKSNISQKEKKCITKYVP